MNDLAIVGVGGQGRENHELIEALNAVDPTWNVLGFLDDSGREVLVHDLPVLGRTDWLKDHTETAVVLGIGASTARRRVADWLRSFGALEFPSLVHPSAAVGNRVEFGVGTVVAAGVVVTTDVSLASFGLLNFGSTIGHDVVAHDFVTVGPGAHVSGNCLLEEGCEIGTGASIVQGMTIGEWSIVGAGATVIEDVPPNSTVVGTPTRVIERRPEGWQLSD